MEYGLSNKLIQSIKEIGEKYTVNKIVLFGSRARGDNKPTGDIDLAIYPLETFTLLGHLANDIDDLDTLLKIDLVFITQDTDTSLIENIEKEGVVLYERL
jgi:predicted nucleotidyltransferase